MSYPYPSPQYADFSPPIRAKLAEVERELDLLHPGWRQKQRFDTFEYDTKARIKWLLKRLSLLGTREGGAPAPRDWEVLIVRDGKNPKQCYAHPVLPAGATEDVTRFPPSPLRMAATPNPVEPGDTDLDNPHPYGPFAVITEETS